MTSLSEPLAAQKKHAPGDWEIVGKATGSDFAGIRSTTCIGMIPHEFFG